MSASVAPLPHGYVLAGAPGAADYLELGVRAGLSPKTDDQAAAALSGSWAACHIVRGLGGVVLSYLLDQIRQRAPAGAYVSLLADGPGRPLYALYGFVESAPGSIGMVLALDSQ